jgi:predicted nucleic acid-binding protein
MSGKRYFFDTNAIVALLKGHPEVVGLAHQADFIAISVISRLEFFAFSALSQHDK